MSTTQALRVLAKYKAKKKVKNKDGEETTVYEYSDKQIANRNREKAKRIEKLRHKIDDVRAKVKKDMKSADPEKMLTALAVGLMDHTFERVGNEESADEGHFGVTGWQRKHVSFGKDVTIKYVGKSGVKHEKKVTDPALKKALRDAYEASDDEDASLFEYEGGKVTAEKVNAYLKEFDVTAKDIRGMHANVEMQERLKEVRKKGGKLPEDKKKREKQLKDEFKEALEGAAEAVGHEPSTLKSQYLVPGLEESYLKDGTVVDKLSHRVLARFLAATQIAYGPAGACLTFQADFPLTTPCEKCGADASLHVTLSEDGPTLETYRPEYDAAVARGWVDPVGHDLAAFATYICPECYAATTLWNQA